MRAPLHSRPASRPRADVRNATRRRCPSRPAPRQPAKGGRAEAGSSRAGTRQRTSRAFPSRRDPTRARPSTCSCRSAPVPCEGVATAVQLPNPPERTPNGRTIPTHDGRSPANVTEALAWGLVAASSLVIGAFVVFVRPPGQRLLGLIMGFGAGVLISAVAYELVADAIDTGGDYWSVALGLGAGALTFFLGDAYIDRMGGKDRKSSARDDDGSPLALSLGIVLDGIPESIALGLTILAGEGVSAAMLAAVFISNLPESIAATTGFERSGHSRRWIVGLWLVIVAVSGFASLAGYVVLDGASAQTISFVLAFAGGAVLTMLADTMMPHGF